jgi:hypothetical protein
VAEAVAEAVAEGAEDGVYDDSDDDNVSIFSPDEVAPLQTERKIRFKVKKHLAKRDAAKKRESRNFSKKIARGKKKLHFQDKL